MAEVETRINGLNRVVVTGIGAVTPLGNNVSETWEGLMEGRSGIRRISQEPGREWNGPINANVDIAGLVKNFDPKPYIPSKELRRIHAVVEYATVAMAEALNNAGLLVINRGGREVEYQLKDVNPTRIGARLGTGVGGGSVVADIEDQIIEGKRIPAVAMLRLLSERIVTVPSMIFGYRGGVAAILAACASANIAQGEAFDKLRVGRADVMLTGGSEAAIHRTGIGAFNAMHALSIDNDEPKLASRPFNKNVGGFVMAEGAGVLVYETLEHALNRGAENRILAEVVGYGETSDAYHDTQPSGEGAVRAMRLALEQAGVQPAEIDYINAHGTSTEIGDKKELEAIEEVFKGALGTVSISSTKSSHGHLLGAAGGVEGVICIKTIQENTVPPTINLRDPLREDLDLVPNTPKVRQVDITMSNSFGFGGINSVIIFRRYKRN